MADAIISSLSANALFDLDGVVAVVTGGGSGIGLMISTTLVANGAKVYIIGPSQTDLDRIAKLYNDGAEKTGAKGRLVGLEGDIRKKSEALRLAEELRQREGHVTVLFNNAGILKGKFSKPTANTADAFAKAHLDSVSQDDFEDVINTNAVGPYWLTFAFLPLLEKWKQAPGGYKFVPQVIMTSSMNGWSKDSATAGVSFPYMFSKSAIGHATASLAHELLPLGIRVNGIAPGLFPTEMSAPGSVNQLGQSKINIVTGFTTPANPGGGSNKDMGSLALMLVSNWFINGETVLIDGGCMLVHPSSY
ncbi:NAD-P-binding protein [Vararia minispora EC-137]|uniref:NAD-P-binding protein n=1 Tax=Vararia minispora EC-137 TaxID=1314806 RepID=A0ACB8QWU0_9AGAM|nr:NAD-P-binding protein [Vararia minispora EC-137]